MFENLTSVLNDFGKFLVEEYKDKLILEDVNASDNLYNSVTYMVEKNNTTYEVKLNLMHYWKYVENGRRAGAKMPPISAIEKWIEVKPVLPRPMTNGKLPTNKQLAYLIARKISIDGIAPRPLLQQSVDEVWRSMQEFIAEALAKDMEKEINIELSSMGV
jgi:hypothetical protein